MSAAWRVAVAVALAVVGITVAPPAVAETCGQHLTRVGTTRAADIVFHERHGGDSPCREIEERSRRAAGREDDDRGLVWERDEPGYGCSLHGCG